MSDNFSKHPIVFYNAENLFDTLDDPELQGNEDFTPEGDKGWDDERYREKLNRLAEALLLANDSTPLAFGMAEIENRQVVEDLIRTDQLRSAPYKIVHFDSEDRRGIDCVFVYDSRFLKAELETKLIVHIEDEPHFRTRDILYIKTLLSGHEIHFFVNHWPSRREGTRESENRRYAAAELLRAEIDEILHFNKDANIIVMGDFNDTPEDSSIREILRAKGQHEQKSGDLINLLIEEHKKGLGTVVHERQWDVFDQLIISQGLLQGQSGLEVEQNNAFIVQNPKLLYTFENGNQKPNSSYDGNYYRGGYSDHLPVFLSLKEK
ncbi:hypothetical protein [Fluviicola sp.]|jgi:hypothetical protein|uniref:endonuclease/exonuclease/phosphatase family protein n=1 Tax=Fluviicola sp. TaxID=1917219 RepID=UPI002825E62B|nr:hypothetical protein [Fluviicola sp.]MDR0802016.1 hypothetical protein [Fluviicola sp.]